jgi:hypothetical protein
VTKSHSWINWVIIIGLLALFGLAAALWPAISGNLNLPGGGSSVSVPVESAPIVIEIPVTTLPNGSTVGGQTIVLEVLPAMVMLTAVVLGLVIMTGLVITIAWTFLDKLRDKNAASESYQEHKTALTQKEKEKLKAKQTERPPRKAPDIQEMPRWSTFISSVIILIFVAIVGMIVGHTLFPEGVVEINGQLKSPFLSFVGIPVLITLGILVWRRHKGRQAEDVEASDDQGYPSDTIAVIVSGLLIFGLGMGLMLYLILTAS